jgi:hypothetical protein
MNRFPEWHGPRFFNRRLGLALLKGFLLGLVLTMTLAGLRGAGIENWWHFLDEYAGLFLAWRFALYGVIVWGWRRVRHLRPSEFESASESRRRWRRTEIAVVGTVILLEAGQLLQRV